MLSCDFLLQIEVLIQFCLPWREYHRMKIYTQVQGILVKVQISYSNIADDL